MVSATTAGFKHLRPITSGTGDAASDADDSSVEAAMKELTVLRGVGPATASAMMMLVDGSCPYMSDEALGLFSGGKALKYTPKAYGEMRGKLKGKAEELRRQTGGVDGVGVRGGGVGSGDGWVGDEVWGAGVVGMKV